MVTDRFNAGINPALAEAGLSHRAYVDALRVPDEVLGTPVALSWQRARGSLRASMLKLIQRGRRVPA